MGAINQPDSPANAEERGITPLYSEGINDAFIKQAEEIAARYQLNLEQRSEGYRVTCAELPGVRLTADSAVEAEEKGRRALVVAVATMLEVGAKPPAPMTDRRAQVNVRLSQADKSLLGDAAKRLGFDNLSDFVRHAAIEKASQLS